MSDAAPVMPHRISRDALGQHTEYCFRCDDRNGYLLSITVAGDGDLHITILTDPDHEDIRVNAMRVAGSVRLRLPMIGGGQHEHLMHGIRDAVMKEAEKAAKEGLLQ